MNENYDFEIEDGVLKWYTGTDAEVVIPDSVHTIARGAFSWCYKIKKIVIP